MNLERTKLLKREWKKKNPDKDRASTRNWVKKNREKVRVLNRNWRINNPDKVRNSRLKYAYGITVEEYNSLLVKQEGKCAICDTRSPGGRYSRFHVDHCHDSGVIRGLLCNRCNIGIGLFEHDSAVFKKAVSYLESVKSQPFGVVIPWPQMVRRR